MPHAGGGTGVFRPWRDGLPADVEIWAVRLPGRDARFNEPAFDRMEPLVEAVSDSIARCIDGPFVMFGHSMGALAAFEVARTLVGRGCEPSGLVVSGSRAPQQPRQPPYLHDLPHDAFVAALTDLGGTPAEVLASADLFDLFEPTLRADFRVVETYTCADLTSVDVPITAFGGRRDTRAPPAAIERWREVAGCRFTSVLIDGGHFF